MTWHDAATLLSIFMAGVFDGNSTVKRDNIPSKWEQWFKNNEWFKEWYFGIGGNARWNPSNPFTADFWHTSKFGIIYSYCAAAAFQIWEHHGVLWAIVAFLVFQFIEGTTFRWFYGYAFRQNPAGNFWTFIRATFNIFGNNHKNDGQ